MNIRSIAVAIGLGLVGCGGAVDPQRDGDVEQVKTSEEALSGAGATVRCTPTNTFGYVAQIYGGDISVSGPRTQWGMLPVSGTLAIKYGQYGGPMTTRNAVHVAGEMDRTGSYANVHVVSGGGTLASMNLNFKDSADPNVLAFSSVNASDTTGYQTRCNLSHAVPPAPGRDIAPSGAMRFYYQNTVTVGLQVDVYNVGELPVTGASAKVVIGPQTYTGALYHYFGSSPSGANTVNPGDRGYIKVDVPRGVLQECASYTVHIDPNHALQAATPDPFANDTQQVSTQCGVTWTAPISTKNVANPDALIVGKSLQDIVSSRVIARADGHRCSDCHFATSGLAYSPPITKGAQTLLLPSQNLGGGRTWAGADGWGVHFIGQGPGTGGNKPQYLRDLVAAWRQQGEQPGVQ